MSRPAWTIAGLDPLAALQAPLDDEDRVEKIGLAAVLSLVPILNIAVVGYRVALIRNVRDGHERPLPEWRDVAGLWWQGLPLVGALWIYAAPAVLALGAGGLFTVAAVFAAKAGGEPLIAVAAVGLVAVVVLVFVSAYSAVMAVVGPTVTLQYAACGTFGSCFAVGEMLASVRERFATYAALWVALFAGRTALSAVLSPVMSALSAVPAVGQLLSMALATVAFLVLMLAVAHLEGQVLRTAGALVRSDVEPAPAPAPGPG